MRMKRIILIFSLFFISCSTVKHVGVMPRTTLVRGVDVLQLDYTVTKAGKQLPTKLFVFDVSLSKNVSLVATSATDDCSSIKAVTDEQTAIVPISKQLEVIQSNRKSIKVLGGVNADFFHINRSNMICGVMYRDGVCLKGSYDNKTTLFALLKNGEACCMTTEEYERMDKSTIVEAVSGRQMLLNDGVVQSAENSIFHPRTAIGVTKDGKRVFILVADGRRKEYSNGLSYADMANIFLKLGAYDAINLDGGGSSSFSVGVGNGLFKPLNRPSDKSGERAVPNGIAVIKRLKER